MGGRNLRKMLRTSFLVAAAALAGVAIIRAHDVTLRPAMAAAPASTAPANSTPASAAPATQPVSQASVNLLEVSANDAFNNGQYALALPMYRRVVANIKDQPDRQGLLEERIRVCEQAVQGGEGGSVPANLARVVMAADVNATTKPSATPTTPLDQTAQPKSAASGKNAAVNVPANAPVGGASSFDPTANFPMTADTRKPHAAPKDGEVLEMPIKELGNFEYDPEKGGNIPADVMKLSGHLFRTQGYMMPLDQADNITEFALVPSLFNCCMGQPPQIQHTIVVHCPKGKAVSYYPDEIVVEGTLKVEEKKDDGYVVCLFEMEARSVKPAAK